MEWISVEDRLPHIGNRAMIFMSDGRMAIGTLAENTKSKYFRTMAWNAWIEEVTHWMPLPEPPK